MDKAYLKELYDNNKEILFDSEQEIQSVDDLINYCYSTISSNFQYDFGINIDTKRLFKK